MLGTVVRNLLFLAIPLAIFASLFNDAATEAERAAQDAGTPAASEPRAAARAAPADRGSAASASAEVGEFWIDADRWGQYHVEGDIDGTITTFVVDTGAWGLVIGPAHARRMGINPAALNYSLTSQTANGVARFAPITFQRVTVGPVTVHDVKGGVMERDVGSALLGMTFLTRLRSYEVRNERLRLRW